MMNDTFENLADTSNHSPNSSLNNSLNSSSTRPSQVSAVVVDHWYFHFWPWVLVLIPFSAVLFGILMVVMVASYPDDLVVDDYYKDGMEINQILTLDKNAAKMGVTAKLILNPGRPLSFQVENADDSALMLNLFHVTDSELDTSVVLYPQDDGVYSAAHTAEMPVSSNDSASSSVAGINGSLVMDRMNEIFATEGIWYVELNGADDSWRLRARVTTPMTTLSLEAK